MIYKLLSGVLALALAFVLFSPRHLVHQPYVIFTEDAVHPETIKMCRKDPNCMDLMFLHDLNEWVEVISENEGDL